MEYQQFYRRWLNGYAHDSVVVGYGVSPDIILIMWTGYRPVGKNKSMMQEANSFGFVSPGFQIVSPHFKFETLYQIAFNSAQSGIENGNRLILGLRFMF